MDQHTTYFPEPKPLRRELSNNPTNAEKALWNGLRKKQTGAKFRRKASTGEFVVDFYCCEMWLVIQLDQQFVSVDSVSNDKAAVDQFLRNGGVSVIHIRSIDLLENYEALITGLTWEIEQRSRYCRRMFT